MAGWHFHHVRLHFFPPLVNACGTDAVYDGSNGGVFGSVFGMTNFNLPQAAVLGIHAIKANPVAVNGQIFVHPIMVVPLTYNHSLMDGREAVTFLVSRPANIATTCDINSLCVYSSCQGMDRRSPQDALGLMKTLLVGP